MNKLLLVVAAIFISCTAFAGEVTVKWQEPEKYTDIQSGDQDKGKFEADLFKNFDSIFAELARKLPDNTVWQITVTDLDLAGEVRPSMRGSGVEMRVVKPIYRPAIMFEYKLLDAQNKVLKEAKVDLKDLGFMSRPASIIGRDRKLYPYEEYMIRQWFEQQQMQKILPGK
ncbi:DUF3016 domain-containing protein [Solimicrobium silvestre]|uniref:DUF3016 domain-containing protein n=1 Tax=Solimicrobium silvestre TaxID=2099400 RepID=A0A2S9H4N2_9BURK|nr:DUF3016 domain-containing protein [Solimicrobium silvestre]PRC94945.1 hypothetical protein S2091_0140 [Solimicrobium silvestre]